MVLINYQYLEFVYKLKKMNNEQGTPINDL